MLTFKKFLLEYATHSPESERRENESDTALQDRLSGNSLIKKEFARYLMEDCIRSLESIKHLNNKHIKSTINLIKQYIFDPSSVEITDFQNAANATGEGSNSIRNAANTAVWIFEGYLSMAADDAAWCATYASILLNNNIDALAVRTRKRQEYIRVAKILLSQHTNDKHDRKDEIIDAINTNNDHKLRVFLNDYIQENNPDLFNKFKKYIEELHGLENISDDQFINLLIENKPELFLFVRQYM